MIFVASYFRSRKTFPPLSILSFYIYCEIQDLIYTDLDFLLDLSDPAILQVQAHLHMSCWHQVVP